jgi:hypothetical protein
MLCQAGERTGRMRQFAEIADSGERCAECGAKSIKFTTAQQLLVHIFHLHYAIFAFERIILALFRKNRKRPSSLMFLFLLTGK